MTPLGHLRVLRTREFSLDGEPVDIHDFIEVHSGVFDVHDLGEIASLEPGQALTYGTSTELRRLR